MRTMNRHALANALAAIVLFLSIANADAKLLLCPKEPPAASYEYDQRIWGYVVVGGLREVMMYRTIVGGKVTSSRVTCIYNMGATYTLAESCKMIEGSGSTKTYPVGANEQINCKLETGPRVPIQFTNEKACMVECDQ